MVGPEPVTWSCFILPCKLCYVRTDTLTARAEQSGLEVCFTPRLAVVQQIFPQDLASRAVSFLRARVVLFVGLVAWLGGDGSVVWGVFLPFFSLSVKIICPLVCLESWERKLI